MASKDSAVIKQKLKAVPCKTYSAENTVVLVDNSHDRTSVLKRALNEFGYILTIHYKSLDMFVAESESCAAAILIIGIDEADDGMLAKIAKLNANCPRPLIMFAERGAPKIIEQSVKSGISAFIVDDIQPQRLTSIITLAVARFKERQSLLKELNDTKSKLADRKVIEKAKGLLMDKQGMSEDDAYSTIRKIAMNEGKSIAMVAETTVNLLSSFD